MSACCLAQTPGQSPYETQKNIEIFLFVLKNFSKKTSAPSDPSFYATHSHSRATNPPITRKEPTEALLSASLRLRSQPGAQAN